MPYPSFERVVESFFAEPDFTHTRGMVSALQLLRQELIDCRHGRPMREERAAQLAAEYRLFASAMVTFAGIDLLAKLYAGTDGNKDPSGEHSGAGKRFKDFVRDYMGLVEPKDADALWKLRNGLVHSFGLHDASKEAPTLLALGSEGSAAMRCSPERVVRTESGSRVVCVDCLYRAFLMAVTRYRDELLQDVGSRRANFNAIYEDYGTIAIWSASRNGMWPWQA